MADSFKIDFLAHGKAESGDLIVFVGDDLQPSAAVAKQIGPKTVELIARAASAENFKGKAKSVMTLVVPAGLPVDRLIVVGVGGEKDRASLDFAQLGGLIAGKVNGKAAKLHPIDVRPVLLAPDADHDEAVDREVRRNQDGQGRFGLALEVLGRGGLSDEIDSLRADPPDGLRCRLEIVPDEDDEIAGSGLPGSLPMRLKVDLEALGHKNPLA
jgi:hypothetical protein